MTWGDAMTWDHFVSVLIGVVCGVGVTLWLDRLTLNAKLPPAQDVDEAIRREKIDATFRERQDARERKEAR